MSRIVVTGAGGFLGQATCQAAEAAGHDVVPLTRAQVDLANGTGLAAHLAGANSVIHVAAGSGDDVAHARDTLQATDQLLAALPAGTRLVLVSSFSVYAFDGIPDWSLLDETAPTDPDGHKRDAYARAKIAQEKSALYKAQTAGLDLWVARPGAIYGHGRILTARLGWQTAGRWFCPGDDAPIPAIHVQDCAVALVAMATVEDLGWPEDLPILKENGHVRIVNLVSPDAPRQSDWLDAIGASKRVILPRRALMRMATGFEFLIDAVPALGRVIPRALQPQTLAARFKPLHYSTHRLQDRLGCIPLRPFAKAMQISRKADT